MVCWYLGTYLSALIFMIGYVLLSFARRTLDSSSSFTSLILIFCTIKFQRQCWRVWRNWAGKELMWASREVDKGILRTLPFRQVIIVLGTLDICHKLRLLWSQNWTKSLGISMAYHFRLANCKNLASIGGHTPIFSFFLHFRLKVLGSILTGLMLSITWSTTFFYKRPSLSIYQIQRDCP